MASNQDTTATSTTTTSIPDRSNDLGISLTPSSFAALKTISSISSEQGAEQLSNCDKLTASLEQIRSSKNIKLFQKLENMRQDFSGLNKKIAQMEESILDLKEVTNELVKALQPTNI